ISNADDIALFGKLDSNYYARPLDNGLLISNNFVKQKESVSQTLDLEAWQKQYKKDAGSKKTPKEIIPYKLKSIVGTNKVSNSILSTVKGMILSSCSVSLGISGLLDDSYLEVTPSDRNSTVYTRIGDLTAGKNYLLKYSVRGTVDSNMTIGTFLRQLAYPYTILTPIQYRKVGKDRNDYEVLFSSLPTDVSATLVFKVDNASKYYLDNIELYEANATVTNPDDSIRFEYNPTNVSKSVALNGSYVDAKSKSYLNSITLQPYTSAILIKSRPGPTVSITSPANDATFLPSSNVTINATAADTDGTISKVEFYEGNTLLGTDNTSPFSFVWKNVATGAHTITANAINNNSTSTISSPVTIVVELPNIPPTINIYTPVNNTSYSPGVVNITISANATDADGSISKVEFYEGNTLLGADKIIPYTFRWMNVGAGTHVITAKAFDNLSSVTLSSPVTISVKSSNSAPSVSIVSPANNTSFTAPVSSITLNATAFDGDGSISKVEFFSGNILIGTDNTSPYSATWKNVAIGNYTITAKATDNKTLSTISSPVIISVKPFNPAPVVNITSPGNNENFKAHESIAIFATAEDENGSVSIVEFYKGNTLLGTDNTRPYSFIWKNVSAGNYTITAKAIDNTSLVTTSSPVTIAVRTPNLAPVVKITNPSDNSVFSSTADITINATAVDDDGSISKVEFYEGNILVGTDNIRPYTLSLKKLAAGKYTITAKATDNGSMTTTSAPVTISIEAPNIPPTVSLTSPENSTIFNASVTDIAMKVTAADTDGTIMKVIFYSGNKLLGTDTTSPYSCTWKSVPAGTYTLTAKAIDNDSLVSISSPVIVSVEAPNIAPVVNITSPANTATFTTSENITINATAIDDDGLISKVEFYNENIWLGTDTTSPYSYTLENAPAGIYTLTAKATDNGSLVSTSSPVTISIIAANLPPTINLTRPANNQIFTVGADIELAADANDADGTISKVEFYRGTSLLRTERYPKYKHTWNNARAGNFVITAKAYDDSGFVTTSSNVYITVKPQTFLSRSANEIYTPQPSDLLDFQLSPNPATNSIQINFESLQSYQKANLSIMDLSGSLLKTLPLVLSNNKIKVDISSLSPGTYIMRISNDKFIINKKFMKVN
ncbi:MAG: Ig-like domain-containing protein, partial [Ginsengibacter sp.]